MPLMKKYLPLIILLISIPNSLLAIKTITLEKFNDTYIGKDIEIYKDTSNKLTIDQIINLPNNKFYSSNTDTLNLGYTDNTVWIKFQIDTKNEKDKTFFIKQD